MATIPDAIVTVSYSYESGSAMSAHWPAEGTLTPNWRNINMRQLVSILDDRPAELEKLNQQRMQQEAFYAANPDNRKIQFEL